MTFWRTAKLTCRAASAYLPRGVAVYVEGYRRVRLIGQQHRPVRRLRHVHRREDERSRGADEARDERLRIHAERVP